MELRENGLNDTKMQEYFKFMVDIAELMGASRSQAELELHESLKFEIELATVSRIAAPLFDN